MQQRAPSQPPTLPHGTPEPPHRTKPPGATPPNADVPAPSTMPRVSAGLRHNLLYSTAALPAPGDAGPGVAGPTLGQQAPPACVEPLAGAPTGRAAGQPNPGTQEGAPGLTDGSTGGNTRRTPGRYVNSTRQAVVTTAIQAMKPSQAKQASKMAKLAAQGDTNRLADLLAQGHTWNWTAYVGPARQGNVALMHWLHLRGCPLNSWVCHEAAKAGQLESLRWLFHVGKCDMDQPVLRYAMRFKHDHIVAWYHERGVPGAGRFCELAAADGDVDVLEQFARLGYTIGPEVAIAAAEHGQLAVLKWMFERGYSVKRIAKLVDVLKRQLSASQLPWIDHEDHSAVIVSLVEQVAKRQSDDGGLYSLAADTPAYMGQRAGGDSDSARPTPANSAKEAAAFVPAETSPTLALRTTAAASRDPGHAQTTTRPLAAPAPTLIAFKRPPRHTDPYADRGMPASVDARDSSFRRLLDRAVWPWSATEFGKDDDSVIAKLEKLRDQSEPYLWLHDEAAKAVHFEALQWFHDVAGVQPNLSVANHAIAQDRRDVLDWGLQRGMPKLAPSVKSAVVANNLALLRWLAQRGWPIAKLVATEAARCGHADILAWVKANHYPIKLRECLAAAEHNATLRDWMLTQDWTTSLAPLHAQDRARRAALLARSQRSQQQQRSACAVGVEDCAAGSAASGNDTHRTTAPPNAISAAAAAPVDGVARRTASTLCEAKPAAVDGTIRGEGDHECSNGGGASTSATEASASAATPPANKPTSSSPAGNATKGARHGPGDLVNQLLDQVDGSVFATVDWNGRMPAGWRPRWPQLRPAPREFANAPNLIRAAHVDVGLLNAAMTQTEVDPTGALRTARTAAIQLYPADPVTSSATPDAKEGHSALPACARCGPATPVVLAQAVPDRHETYLLGAAVAAGDVGLLQRLHDDGFQLSADLFVQAAARNQTRVMEWLRGHGCCLDARAISPAAAANHADAVWWLNHAGCESEP